MDRLENITALEPLLEAAFASADAATWIARCEEASVPCGPINDFGQAMNDPHYIARGMIEEIEHPKLGSMRMIGIPTKFSKTPGAIRKAAPLLGEDTDTVLRRFGVSDDQISGMRDRGAIQ